MPAPSQIETLAERFEQNLESYRSGIYNETQLRREFIDPMFKAFGWDMDNVSGYAEAYKDVIHEDAIKIGGCDQGAGLLLSHRWNTQIFSRSKEAIRGYQNR